MTKTISKSERYLNYIRTCDCAIDNDCKGDVVPHHIVTGGKGIKCSDYYTIPLCHKHHGEVHSGSVLLDPLLLWRKVARCLSAYIEDKKITRKTNRSLAQNALYWKWLTVIGTDLGYFKDELHAVFAIKFLSPKLIIALGETARVIPSTSSLTVQDFASYLNQVEQFAITELGMRLPRPDDLYYDALMKDEGG